MYNIYCTFVIRSIFFLYYLEYSNKITIRAYKVVDRFLYYYYRTIFKEDLNRVDKRLDKISAALYGLRPRYLTLDLLAKILLIFITILFNSHRDK